MKHFLPLVFAATFAVFSCSRVPQVKENSLEAFGLAGKVHTVNTESFRIEDGDTIRIFDNDVDGLMTFGEDGMLLEQEGLQRMTFRYDVNGTMTGREVYQDDSLLCSIVCASDSEGRLLRESLSSPSGKAEFTVEYSDDDTAVETETNFNGDTTTVTFMCLDSYGRITSFYRDWYDTEYRQNDTIEYWPDGRIRYQTIVSDLEGIGKETVKEEYDASGRLLSRMHSSVGDNEDEYKLVYEYEDDSLGNWVVQYVYRDKILVGKVKRTITYYDEKVSE